MDWSVKDTSGVRWLPLCFVWLGGKLLSTKVHSKRIKRCTLNLGEINNEGMLDTATNVRDLFMKWRDVVQGMAWVFKSSNGHAADMNAHSHFLTHNHLIYSLNMASTTVKEQTMQVMTQVMFEEFHMYMSIL